MTGVIREDAGSEWVFLCLQPCEEHLSSEGKGDHGNLSNEDICLFPLLLKSSHTKKNLCVCVCLWESKPGLLCLQQSLRSAVERGHRLFSFFSPRHTESSCCFLLFMALQLFFNSALCVFLHTSLCQCFPSPRLRNLPHLLLAPLCHGGKSLYCFSRSLSVWSLELCQSVFSRTLEIHSHDSLETLIHTLLKRSSFQWLKGIRHIYGPPISKNIPYIINFFIYKIQDDW